MLQFARDFPETDVAHFSIRFKDLGVTVLIDSTEDCWFIWRLGINNRAKRRNLGYFIE